MRNRNSREDRKVFQLCAQVKRSLVYALAESDDEIVSELYVDDVEPYPNASRLLVRVFHDNADRPDILERLALERGRLRCAIAGSIHRKKTPQLAFELAVPQRTSF